ncbi:Sad1/UNC-like [Macleaya cordata]|uniref:Sad1/UNC-like n=1 Tax=Macleaya cordata TaxID=56857 RepID=A0A200PSR6_MACCD|nr:Sad1/UNC-like [Macleaya cordata]
MSGSTVAVTANPAVNNSSPSLALGARRRSVAVTEKKSSNFEMVGEGGGGVGVSEPIGTDGRDLSHTIKGETTLDRERNLSSLQVKKGMMNSTISPRRRKVISKPPEKPLWRTILSVFTKNFLLLLVLLGLVQMIRKLALNSGDGVVYPMGISEVEGRIAEVESFLKTTTKLMQVQMDVTNRMIESEVSMLRSELTKKVEDKGVLFETELKKLEARSDDLDKSLGELKANGFYTKEDFERFLDEFETSKPEGSEKDWSLDDIRAFAKELVEKEIERHAADGLGMVDYALASGGAVVVEHSEPYMYPKGTPWYKLKNQNGVHPDAQKMLEPSFGEPGRCFPLKGNNGFVTIILRSPIIPEAVTLEHVAKSVAYDRSSAPKDCRISGWFQGPDAAAAGAQSRQGEKKFLLSEFVYDLDKSNAQTFKVESTDAGIVNMIRLDFASNHGGPHTCIYRLRVHGHEPDSVALSKLES